MQYNIKLKYNITELEISDLESSIRQKLMDYFHYYADYLISDLLNPSGYEDVIDEYVNDLNYRDNIEEILVALARDKSTLFTKLYRLTVELDHTFLSMTLPIEENISLNPLFNRIPKYINANYKSDFNRFKIMG